MPLINRETLSQLREMGSTRPAPPRVDTYGPPGEIIPLRVPGEIDLVDVGEDEFEDFPFWVDGPPGRAEWDALDPESVIDTTAAPSVVPDFTTLRPRDTTGDEDIERGIDVYGWYRSFHLEPQAQWGIYMRDWGLFEIARKAFLPAGAKPGDRADMGAAIAKAVRLLLLHECFHFVVDVAAASLEVLQDSRDLAAFGSGDTGAYRHWLDYFEAVYLGGAGPGRELEEALANAYCFEHLRPKGRARTFMRGQPPGYRDFEAFLGARFDVGLRELAGLLLCSKNPDPAPGPAESIFMARDPWRVMADVPIYLVQEVPTSPYTPLFIDRIPLDAQMESPQFVADLKDRPDLQKPVEKARRLLAGAVRHGSLNFEKLKGRRVPPLFSVRVNKGNRLFLERRGDEWWLLRVGPHDLYRSIA